MRFEAATLAMIWLVNVLNIVLYVGEGKLKISWVQNISWKKDGKIFKAAE